MVTIYLKYVCLIAELITLFGCIFSDISEVMVSGIYVYDSVKLQFYAKIVIS